MFIFDRIKIVEVDRVMEVMKVDDNTGSRAPLVKIRLGVEFPLSTSHTDCTAYLKYLLDMSGEIHKSKDRRKRRSLHELSTGTSKGIDRMRRSVVEEKSSGGLGKNSSGSNPHSNSIGRSGKTTVASDFSVGVTPAAERDSVADNEIEDYDTHDTNDSGFWSFFTSMVTPLYEETDSPAAEKSHSGEESGKISDTETKHGSRDEEIGSSNVDNSERNFQSVTPPNKPEDYGTRYAYPVYGAGASKSDYPYEGADKAVSVEDFPFGIYGDEPYHFDDQFSK